MFKPVLLVWSARKTASSAFGKLHVSEQHVVLAGQIQCKLETEMQQLVQECGSFQRAWLIDIFTKNSSVMRSISSSSVVHKCCNAAVCAELTAQSTIARLVSAMISVDTDEC